MEQLTDDAAFNWNITDMAQLKPLIKGLLMGVMGLYSMPEKDGLSAQVLLFSERLEAHAIC